MSLPQLCALQAVEQTGERLENQENTMGKGIIMQNPLTRKCERCGATLTDEDVMKIQIEDGSWETIPLPVCPGCFAQQMRELALVGRQESEQD